MLLYGPVGLGIIIGIIILGLSSILKKRISSSMAKVPGYLGLLAAIIIFCIGYFKVRGFEGAAYLFLSITIFIFSIITFFSSKNK